MKEYFTSFPPMPAYLNVFDDLVIFGFHYDEYDENILIDPCNKSIS